MVRPPAPLPESFPWTAFTRTEAHQHGILSGRLRRSDLERVRGGLYVRRAAELFEVDIASALCRGYPGAVVVGPTAARIHGLPLPRSLETWTSKIPVHLAFPGGRRGSDAVVRWHDYVLGPKDVHTVSVLHPQLRSPSMDPLRLPLLLTSRARTWRDLAGHLSHFRLVAIGDHLVRRPRARLEQGRSLPWCTPAELAAQCTGRHASALRRALAEVRIGADSPRETMLRLAFARAGLPEPRINVPLIGDHGAAGHSPDFQWPEYQVAAEYDGAVHNGPDQVARDINRARRVRDAGWTEVRLHAQDAQENCERAVQLVRKELRARGWRP